MFDKICLAEKAMNFQTFFLMLSELWITDALMHRWGPYSSLVRFTELHWGQNETDSSMWEMVLQRMDLGQHCKKNNGGRKHWEDFWFILQGS